MRQGDHESDKYFYFISVTLPSQNEANREAAETGYFVLIRTSIDRATNTNTQPSSFRKPV